MVKLLNCMQQTSSAILEDVAQQLGMRQEDLVQQSLRYFLEGKIRALSADLAILKNKYQILSIEAFDELYESGAIEEKDSWRDYQQFDNLSSKINQLQELLKELQ